MLQLFEYIKGIFAFDPNSPLLFTHFQFWAFFAIVFASFSLLQSKTLLRNAYLFFVSLLFYYKTSGLFVGLLLAESGVEHHFCEQMKRGAEMITQSSRIECGLLFGGIGIDFTTDALNVIDDLAGGIMLSSLEDAMLDVVRHAVLIGQFMARARADHDTHIYDWRSGLAVHNLHPIG